MGCVNEGLMNILLKSLEIASFLRQKFPNAAADVLFQNRWSVWNLRCMIRIAFLDKFTCCWIEWSLYERWQFFLNYNSAQFAGSS